MGLYGIGRAFNLKYRPNGPLKTFIYDRRMPVFDFGCRGPRGGYGGFGSFMQQNITVDYGKRGFWGNFADVLYGLTAGFSMVSQMFGFGNNQVDYASMNQQQAAQNVKPQGANSDDELKNLQALGKASGYTTVVKDPSGDTYTAFNPTTHDSITGDYKTVQEHMLKKPDKEPSAEKKEKTELEKTKEELEKTKAELEKAKADNTEKDPDTTISYNGARPQGTTRARKSGRSSAADEAKKAEEAKKTEEAEKAQEAKNKANLEAQKAKGKKFGIEVADKLVGYTTEAEQKSCTEIITKGVSNKNIKAFLDGYESNRGMGDHFFKQLGSEYGYSGKYELCKNVAQKLSSYCKANGQADIGAKIDALIKAGKYSEIDNLLSQIK